MEMTLEQVLEKLDCTMANMKTLEDDHFKYNSFVSKYDEKNKCGSICCVAGWYPKWYPDSVFKWKPDYFGFPCDFTLGTGEITNTMMVKKSLAEFHGFSENIVSILFWGHGSKRFDFVENAGLDLFDVILRFEKMRNLLATGEISPDFLEF